MSQLHPFLMHFKECHDDIIKALNHLSKDEKSYGAYFAYYQSRVSPFFNLEEKLLFAAISAKANVSSGGPLCMLFYAQYQQSPPLERAEGICEIKIPRPNPNNVSEHQVTFFKNNSPVCIPIMDHIACDNISICALEKLKNSLGRNSEAILSHLVAVHLDILKGSFEKKDNCLIPMSQELLSEQEMGALALKLDMESMRSALKHST